MSTLDAAGKLRSAESVVGPDSVAILFAWAELAWGRHDHVEVQRVVERILALEPENSNARAMLGDLESAGANLTPAARHYEEAARLAPDVAPGVAAVIFLVWLTIVLYVAVVPRLLRAWYRRRSP